MNDIDDRIRRKRQAMQQEQAEQSRAASQGFVNTFAQQHLQFMTQVQASGAYQQAVAEANSPQLKLLLGAVHLIYKPTQLRSYTKKNGFWIFGYEVRKRVTEPVPFEVTVTSNAAGLPKGGNFEVANTDQFMDILAGKYTDPIITTKMKVGYNEVMVPSRKGEYHLSEIAFEFAVSSAKNTVERSTRLWYDESYSDGPGRGTHQVRYESLDEILDHLAEIVAYYQLNPRP